MRRAHALAAGVVAAVVIGAMWASRPAVPESHTPAVVAPAGPAAPRPTVVPAAGVPHAVRVFQRGYARATVDVRSACGLDLRPTCQGGVCASVVVMPDMDRAAGWLGIVTRSPTFVASTILRDLGVPSTGLPCGRAIEVLTANGGIEAVELSDGTEVWCTIDASARPAGWREQGLKLCTLLAARAVPGATFTGRLRPLDFRVPSDEAVVHGVHRDPAL